MKDVVLFNPHQEMKSARAEVAKLIYKEVEGKDGRVWYIPDNVPNKGDNLLVADPTDQQGFGGGEVVVDLTTGEAKTIKGPWMSNSAALFADTGIDTKNLHYMRYVIAVHQKWNGFGRPIECRDVLEIEKEPVLSSITKIKEKAEAFAKDLGYDVHYVWKSTGGSSQGRTYVIGKLKQ